MRAGMARSIPVRRVSDELVRPEQSSEAVGDGAVTRHRFATVNNRFAEATMPMQKIAQACQDRIVGNAAPTAQWFYALPLRNKSDQAVGIP